MSKTTEKNMPREEQRHQRMLKPALLTEKGAKFLSKSASQRKSDEKRFSNAEGITCK